MADPAAGLHEEKVFKTAWPAQGRVPSGPGFSFELVEPHRICEIVRRSPSLNVWLKVPDLIQALSGGSAMMPRQTLRQRGTALPRRVEVAGHPKRLSNAFIFTNGLTGYFNSR